MGAQALAAGRLGDPDALGERGVREATVRIELGEHRQVDGIERGGSRDLRRGRSIHAPIMQEIR